MKKAKLCVLAVVLGLFILGLTSSNAGAVYLEDGSEDVVTTSAQLPEGPEYVPGEIIVKFKSPEIGAQIDKALSRADKVKKLTVDSALSGVSSIADFKATSGVKILEAGPVFPALKEKIENTGMTEDELAQEAFEKSTQGVASATLTTTSYGLSRVYKLKIDESSTDIPQACAELAKDPDIEYAEPNYIYKIQRVPNDPYYHSSGLWDQDYDDLWGLKKIQCEAAWDITIGSPDVIVAVVDTGVGYNHKDLSANIWINEDEVPDNGIDDDGNGYIDDVRGWDFHNNNNDPLDDHYHGTHVSGTIAAVGNNGVGVVGVSWNSKIMSLKGLSDQGSGSTAALVKCLTYAADNGAGVINCSWGALGFSQLMKDAVDYVHDVHNCVVVAAAGNSNRDAGYFSPAGYKNVITVASFDHNDEKASSSNWGAKIDVAAPGVGILSTVTSGYESELTIISPEPGEISSRAFFYSALTSSEGVTAELIECGRGETSDFQGKNVSGRIALIERGDITFQEKVINAYNAGAVGAVIYNNEPGNFFGTLQELSSIPACSIAMNNGQHLAGLSSSGPVVVNMAVVETPDFYNPISGTSMACPHVCGLAALILAHHPEFTNEEVRGVIRASADDVGELGWDIYAGHGRINAANALSFGGAGIADIASPETGTTVGGIIEITGTAQAAAFNRYRLEYAMAEAPETWFLIGEYSSPVSDGVLGSWNCFEAEEGDIILRLTVFDGFNNQFSDYALLVIERIFITYPEDGDILSTGIIEIRGGANSPTFQNYTVEYRKQAYGQPWSSDGIILTNQGDEPVLGVLATWDASSLAEDDYELRLTVYCGDDQTVEEVQIYLDPTLKQGWPVYTSGSIQSSIAIADIDPSYPGLEIVVGCDDGGLYLWHEDGTGGILAMTDGGVVSSPAVADLDPEYPGLEIVVGSDDQGIHAWHCDGTVFGQWPVYTGSSVTVAPAIADVDEDGDLEIVIGVEKVYVLSWNGVIEESWDFQVPEGQGTRRCQTAVADIDPDYPGLEIVAGRFTDSSWVYLYAWHCDGTTFGQWPKHIGYSSAACPWSGYCAVGDIDLENPGLEIVTTTSGGLYIMNSDGTKKDSTGGGGHPVIGDIDADGDLEIIASRRGELDVLDEDVNLIRTISFPYEDNLQRVSASSFSILGDIDADGQADILIAGEKGEAFAWKSDGSPIAGWPKRMLAYGTVPALADIDADGDIEVSVASYTGKVYVWDLQEAYDQTAMEWPMLHHDPQRTGFYSESVTQTIDLSAGWNIFSLAVTPQGSQDMLRVLAPVLGYAVRVQDETGASIEKHPILGQWINNIGDWQATEGYKIYVDQDVTLEVVGIEIAKPLPVPLLAGWNIISYPYLNESRDALEVMQPLIDAGYLVKVQDEGGAAIEEIPGTGRWVNSIGNMDPGEGYKIYVNTACTLVYTDPPDQTIDLSAGWNIFSLAVTPQGSQDMLDVLDSILDHVIKVEDEEGASIERGLWNNSIGDMEPGEGYEVHVTQDCTLVYPAGLAEEELPVTQAISLSVGLDFFSLAVTPQGSQDMLDVLAPILDHVIKVQDGEGTTIEEHPILGQWINNIGDWQATEGYKIYVDQPVTLEVTGIEIAKPFTVPLRAGRNVISYPYLNESRDALEVMQPLIDAGYLIRVEDEAGGSVEELSNEWGNNIGDWEASEGYKIYVDQPVTLEVAGREIAKPFSVPLVAGWNIISYPYLSESRDALAVVQPLIDAGYLIKVQDEYGAAIEKHPILGYWINNIGNMQPGEGYKVYVTQSCTLVYPEPMDQVASVEATGTTAEVASSPVESTPEASSPVQSTPEESSPEESSLGLQTLSF